jgi:4'-phosphopantetheinyl transferase EntD
MARRAPNPPLFPPFVAQCSVAFDLDEEFDPSRAFPGIELPATLSRAVRKRKIEFLAGRHCAREALRICAPAYAERQVAVGANREPLWPEGIVGAITHTNKFASVAVARREDARGIGLDVENVVSDTIANDIVLKIATRDEIAALVRETGWNMATVLTLVFSAKESVFKCLFPEVRRYFDFLDAFVFAIDTNRKTFSVRLVVTLTAGLGTGMELGGHFEHGGDSICTALVLLP